ncbi:MAG: 30S ribosomal protein S6 [Atribacterota bacterium]
MMNQYELSVVIKPTLSEDEVKVVVDRVKTRVGELGGEIDGVNVWGKRRLAYVIRKQTEGIYVFLNFRLSPDAVKEMVRFIHLNEEIIRHIVVKEEKKVTPVSQEPQSSAQTSAVTEEKNEEPAVTAVPGTTSGDGSANPQ